MKTTYNITGASTPDESLAPHPHDGEDNAASVCLLTAQGVAQRLNVSERTVNRLVESGEITPIDIRGAVRYHPHDVDDLIERGRRPARRPTTSQPVRKPTRKPQTATRSFRERRRAGGR